MAAPLRKSSGSPVFSGVAPSLSRSWQRSIVTLSSSGFVWMLLLASEKVSGISFSDQILASGEEKRTLWTAFPPLAWEAVFGQEDANLVGDGRASVDPEYGSEGSENGMRTDEGGSEWACWLSLSPVFSVFCPFPMSIGRSGMEDSGTKGISSWEVGVVVFVSPMAVSPAGCESGIWTVLGASISKNRSCV